MADGIYVSMCGAVARAEQLDAVADNLANAQTPGFKAARPAFESFLAPGAAQDKRYAAAVASGVDLRPGPTQRTGNALDVVPEAGLFLAVRTAGGATAYTRDGRLTLDADRRLVSDGRPLLSAQGEPIVLPPDLDARVDAAGRVWAGDVEVATLGLARLDGPVDRVGPSLLAPGAGGRALPSEGAVRSGELELGNAGALEASIQLVAAQRAYEASLQAIQTYRQLDQRAVEVARVK
ncbi:flagellar hook basal-body protein [Anaeromyxobacter dehalogenans]|uniref:Flagellar basal body rod protein n=1 Tax=Anaeromyxobacter dehalogenans (strain 2CP-C) TaxID=290397 RepID=Q2IQP5_ANADE|nr:flagellar hook basal-body protein [Anaeromyxobacter dehalogenans]ABC81126.1 flagellar basal body rod protein [Anaeromyxobacter dehalogenans 2CP-C]